MRGTAQAPGHGWRTDASGAAPGARIDGLAYWSLLAFTVVLVLAPQEALPALQPLRVALLAGALATSSLLLHRFVHRRPWWPPAAALVPAAGMFAWAALTLPVSMWPGGSADYLVEVYLKTLVVFWLLANALDTPARLRGFILALSLMSVPLALTALRNFLAGVGEAPAGAAELQRIVGYRAPLTHNPNDLALMLNLILPLTLALARTALRPWLRAALVASAGLALLAILATFSRAGFLTLLLVIAALAWQAGVRRRLLVAAAVGVLALASLPTAPGGYSARMGTILDPASDPTGSAQARWTDTVAALEHVARSPLIGAGVGMDVLALNEIRGPTWKDVHNAYLQHAVELGLPGLLLFLLLLRRCRAAAAQAEAAARAAGAGDLAVLASGIRVSILAFAFAALFYPVAYQYYFYLIAGLAVAAHAVARAGGAVAEQA